MAQLDARQRRDKKRANRWNARSGKNAGNNGDHKEPTQVGKRVHKNKYAGMSGPKPKRHAFDE